MALSDSRPTRRLCDGGVASPRRDGSPPMTRITFPTCRAPYPGGSRRVLVSIASPLTRPSPFPRRVGIRIFTFEASSGFTRVTARWIAQPPKAAFVTRLRPGQLPGQAARQLPDQSTTLWVEPSSTGDTRRRGAPGNAGFQHHNEFIRVVFASGHEGSHSLPERGDPLEMVESIEVVEDRSVSATV